MKIAILCIGNRLMLDDGVGPAVYDALEAGYRFGDDVALYDAGCMTMDLLPHVCKADFVIVVDAVDGTGEQPGMVFRFAPGDIAGHGAMQSLHDMRLSDLLASASLLGYEADGVCFGIQVENMSPASFIEGLTPRVHAALPLLVDSVLAELVRLGVQFHNADGTSFVPPSPSDAECVDVIETIEPAKPADFGFSTRKE